MEVTSRLVEERSCTVFGGKGDCFVIRTFEPWGYPLGIKRRGKSPKDCKRTEVEYIPGSKKKSFVSSRQGQGVDVADFGINACPRLRAERAAGREGSGPFHPTKNQRNAVFSPFCLLFFQMCDSDRRGLDLSIRLRMESCTRPERFAPIVGWSNTTLGNTDATRGRPCLI
jgi:hypothetical protein